MAKNTVQSAGVVSQNKDTNGKPNVRINTTETLSKGEQSRIKSISVDVLKKFNSLTKKDTAAWRRAWNTAINPNNPRRTALYDIYQDVMIDNHLCGCIDQRKGFVLKKAFKLIDKKTLKENPIITENFEIEWFKDFMSMVLDSRYYGHSLIQFNDIIRKGDKLQFDGVELVPREHVIPEYGLILRDVGDELKKGISFKEGKYSQWVIEAGKKNDLGLLLKVANSCIPKKNMLSYWDTFGEIFGIPIRIATTASRDENEINKIESMMENMGAASYAVLPDGTTVQFIESSRGDAFNIYDKRIDRANSEISKAILNQTMTIDNGSSHSQSEVHLEIFQNVVEADADFLRDIINNRLLPFMTEKGFGVDDYRFDWDDSIDYSPEQMLQIEQMLLLNGYEIEPKYFIERYNIPIIGSTKPQMKMLAQRNTGVEEEDFFV